MKLSVFDFINTGLQAGDSKSRTQSRFNSFPAPYPGVWPINDESLRYAGASTTKEIAATRKISDDRHK